MALLNPKYPHLLPDDIPVWERFLAAHPEIDVQISYDVRVGIAQDPGPAFPEPYRQMAITLSYKRIDAVMHWARESTIIEITRRAGLKAIGQLITYPILFAQAFPDAPPPRPLLIAEMLLPDTIQALNAYSIEYELFPPGASSIEAPGGTISNQAISKDTPNETNRSA